MSLSEKKTVNSNSKDSNLTSKGSISSPSLRSPNIRPSSVTFQELDLSDKSFEYDKKSGSTPSLLRKKNLSTQTNPSSSSSTIDKMKKKHIIKEYDDLQKQVESLHCKLQQAYQEIEELKHKWISTTGNLPDKEVSRSLQSACACDAAANGDINTLQQMLERGADIHGPNGDGRTSLHLAILKGHDEVAEFLLNSGASLHVRDQWGCTPFDESLRLNRCNIARMIEVFHSTQTLKNLEREYRLADFLSQDREQTQKRQDLPRIQRKISSIMSIIEGNSSPMELSKSISSSIPNNKLNKNSKVKSEPHISSSPTIQRNKHDKKKQNKSNRGFLRMLQTLIKGNSHSNRDIQEMSSNDTQKPYCVAFGILRGSCQVISCRCDCYSPNEKSTKCTCGHFPASHENLGTEHLLEGLQHLNIIEESSLEVLVEKEPGQEWPKKLNLNLEGDENTEELAQIWKDEKKEWIIKANDLTFLRKIGQGASATVYEGLYKNQKVAIKLMNFKPNNKKPSEKIRHEMIEEFNIMSTFKKDHVVKFYGVCVETRLCMVLEFCEHGSLYDLIQDDFDLTWELVFKWMKQTVKGVEALHSWNPPIVHRDLKTLNLLVDDQYNIKVADFGLSRFVKDSSSQTTLVKLRGTYAYAAPEVYLGENFSFKSDVYSIAIIFWELLTKAITGIYHRPYGEFAFISYDFQIIIQVAKKNARPTIHENFPKIFKELITTLWDPNPDKRPDCKMLLKAIEDIELLFLNNIDEWNSLLKNGKSLDIQTSHPISRKDTDEQEKKVNTRPKSSSNSKNETNSKSTNSELSQSPTQHKLSKSGHIKSSSDLSKPKSSGSPSVQKKLKNRKLDK